MTTSEDPPTQATAQPSELTDRPVIAKEGTIEEKVDPGEGQVYATTPGRRNHPDTVRKQLSYGLLIILATVVVTVCIGWLLGASTERIEGFALVLSPIVTLVGTTLGFYFSSTKPHRL